MSRQLEIEEQALEDDLNNGVISLTEYNRELRSLHRDYRYAAQESAEQAYSDEMDRW